MFGRRPKNPADKIFKEACELYKKNDYGKAAELFRQAADLGSAEAMSDMGLLYYLGQGVPQVKQYAIEWWTKAAEAGETLEADAPADADQADAESKVEA